MRYIQHTVGALFLLAVHMHSSYAGLTIDPVRLELNGDRQSRSATISLDSKGERDPRNYEISVMKWTQDASGEDVLIPADDVIVNPKTINLQPESKKAIRIGFRQPVSEMNFKQQESWRLLFNEIPSLEAANGINMTVSFSVPFFVNPTAAADRIPKLSFKLHKNSQGIYVLNAQNLNKNFVKIMNIKLRDASNTNIASIDQMKYLLADKQYDFPLGKMTASQKIQAVVTVDDFDHPFSFDIAE